MINSVSDYNILCRLWQAFFFTSSEDIIYRISSSNKKLDFVLFTTHCDVISFDNSKLTLVVAPFIGAFSQA